MMFIELLPHAGHRFKLCMCRVAEFSQSWERGTAVTPVLEVEKLRSEWLSDLLRLHSKCWKQDLHPGRLTLFSTDLQPP